MRGSQLPSPFVLHTGIGPIPRPTYLLVSSTTPFNSAIFPSPLQTAQRAFPTRSLPILSNARSTGASLSSPRLFGTLVRTLLQVSRLLKRESLKFEYGTEPALTCVGAEMLGAMPGTETFSGIAGGPSTGQRPGHNSVTRVLPRDRVRDTYFLHTDHSMLNDIPGANSLETLHNWMHNRTGGGGHMSNPISAGACLLSCSHEP